MALIRLKKEKVVVSDLEVGMGTVIQDRGEEEQINSAVIPYSESTSISDELNNRYTKPESDSLLATVNQKLNNRYTKPESDALAATKLALSGGTLYGRVTYSRYPTLANELATVEFVMNNSGGGPGGGTDILWQGVFTPELALEYPDNPNPNEGWFIDVASPYTFVLGDLVGTIVIRGDQIIYTAGGWVARDNALTDALYYRLDGTHPLESHLSAGGYNITQIGNGVEDTDAVNVGQLESRIASREMGDLSDVNDSNRYDGSVLSWDNTLQLWTASDGTPKTAKPTTDVQSLIMYQNSTELIRLTNYTGHGTIYTLTPSDSTQFTATQHGHEITVTSADVSADVRGLELSIIAQEPLLAASPPAIVVVDITYVPFVSATIANNNFQHNSYYVDGFNFI